MCLGWGELMGRGWELPPTMPPTRGLLVSIPCPPSKAAGPARSGRKGWDRWGGGRGRAVRLRIPHGSFSRMGWGVSSGWPL